MTKTYKIAEELAIGILNVENARYEALKERDLESYDNLDTLEVNLKHALESFGYEVSLVYDDSPMLYCEENMAFKAKGVRIREIKEEN